MQIYTNRDFPPLSSCLQTLEVLISKGDIGGVGLAEEAIDEFLGWQDDLNVRSGDLHVLEQELITLLQKTTGDSHEFVNLVCDYVESRRRDLQPDT